jgi:hypothetical protein
MAHFARIQDNVVQQVIVINNSELLDTNANEQESLGVAFCQSLFGASDVWTQTSYNSNLRKNFAGIGYTYDLARDSFIAPRPYASWVLNESTCRWEAPTPRPDEDHGYSWDESTTSWTQLTDPE